MIYGIVIGVAVSVCTLAWILKKELEEVEDKHDKT